MKKMTKTIQEISNIPQDVFLRLCQKFVEENDFDSYFDAIHARCASDIEAFAIIFFPHYCIHDFNEFHRDKMDQYTFGERAVRRVDAAPRGYAKSTIKVLIKPIHDLCYKLERFIVVASNTEAQSLQKLKDIQSELITNDLLIMVYGNFFKTRRVGTTDFIAHCGSHQCRFLAVGSDTEIRGIRFGESRPSKIILDDIEHSEEVENETIRESMLRWYQDVITKIGDENTNIEFIGTVLHQKSLLKEILSNPRYESNVYIAIESWAERKDLWDEWKNIYINLDDFHRLSNAKAFYMHNKAEMDKGTKVLWPDKEPYYALMEEIIESGIRSFMKEKQNCPMSDQEKVFNPDDIWWYSETPQGLLIEKTNVLIPWAQLSAYGVIDPSTGQTKAKSNRKPDFTCIPTGYYDAVKKRLFVHHDYTKRVSPSEFIKEIFRLHEKYNYYKFGVETNLFRNLLQQNIKDERIRIEKEQKKQILVKFYDIDLVDNKEKRIYSIEPKVYHGHILFNRNGVSQEFMNQLYDFPKAVHDDCPDALEMLWGLVNNKYRVGAIHE